VEALRKHPAHPSMTDQSCESFAVQGGVQFAGDVRDAQVKARRSSGPRVVVSQPPTQDLGAGMLKSCLGPAFEILCGHLSVKSLRRLSWVSKVLCNDLFKQPKLFECIGGVASEARALQKAAELDLSDGRGGTSALVANALPKIVDAKDVFAFLRDSASADASEAVVTLDVPVVCLKPDGRLYCDSDARMTSPKEQCRFLTNNFPARCRTTKLSIVVTQPACTTNQLGSRGSEPLIMLALETRLGRLYRGCGTSVTALIQICPSLTALSLDIRFEGHAGDRFWEGICLALESRQVQHVTKLTLRAALPDDALCFASIVHWIIIVASKFNALTELDCDPRVRAAWKEKISDSFCRPLPPSLVL